MRHTEAQEQEALAEWLDVVGCLWCHAPNEGKRSPRYGAKLKRQGLKRGVPDVLIFAPMKFFLMPTGKGWNPASPVHGWAIELKRHGEVPTADQTLWLDELEKAGWHTLVARSAIEAANWLRSEWGA